MAKWRCTICGQIIEGDKAPDECPVCGVGAELFVKLEEDVVRQIAKWKCTICGDIVDGDNAPDQCLVCGVGAEFFIKIEEENESKEFNDEYHIVIIGASGAGMSAAEEIRKRNKKCSLTIISKEEIKGYYRPQLTKLLSTRFDPNSITIKGDKWFKDNNIKLMLKAVVEKIDVKNKTLISVEGKELKYDKLIIASGAEVFVPPLAGRDKKGVYTLRYMKDLYEIKEYAKDKKTVAIIGGGILGLEAASELNNLGLKVTVLERNNRILNRQLDENGSVILEDIIKESGVTIRKFASSKEIVGDEKVNGVLLEDGETILADLVIISTGVKSNCKIAIPDIEVKKAIVVNKMMETNVPDVYACGDCAEFNGVNYALWSQAIEQGKAAGINAVGDECIYEQIIPSTTLNAFNSSVFSIGDIGSKKDVDYEVYEVMEKENKNYKKMYFVNGSLAGGILIGDKSKTVELMDGFEKNKSKDEMIKKFN